MRKVCIITDHKPLVAIHSKDVAMLSQWLQCIMLGIHQYGVCIIYLYIMDWLFHNMEIAGIKVNMNAISISVNIPVCTLIEDIQGATHDAPLQEMKAYIIQG